MKKVCVFVLVCLLSVGAVFAAARGASDKDSWGIGLNVGTNNGVIINYGMGKFDLEGIIGFSVFHANMDVEIAANYMILDVAEKADFAGSMPFTVGAEGYLTTDFDDFGLGVLVPLKLTYTFPKVPVSLYFRVAPGILFNIAPDFDVDFGIHASLGATYNF